MAIVTQRVVWVTAHGQLNYPSHKSICTITSNHHHAPGSRRTEGQHLARRQPPSSPRREIREQANKCGRSISQESPPGSSEQTTDPSGF
eukprot:502391-Amphidinium_carterae.1